MVKKIIFFFIRFCTQGLDIFFQIFQLRAIAILGRLRESCPNTLLQKY